jgi:ABC-type uncharacterized transport system permease subunit
MPAILGRFRLRLDAPMLATVFAFAIVGYVVSALAFYLALVRAEAAAAKLMLARRILSGTVVVHLTDIVAWSVATHSCPVLSAAPALSLTALIATTAFLAWARDTRQLYLGVIVAPVALGLFLSSSVLLLRTHATEVPGWYLAVHVLVNLLAVALFVLAAVAAIAYLFQAGRLKSKRRAVVGFSFPGLSLLESFMERALAVGLGFMTAGVVSGAVFAERISQGGLETARVALAYATWLAVAVLVVSQRLVGWNGRKVAYGAILVASTSVAVVVLYAIAVGGRV